MQLPRHAEPALGQLKPDLARSHQSNHCQPVRLLVLRIQILSADEWTCTATLTGFSMSVAGETIALSQVFGYGTVTVSPTSCALRPTGTRSWTATGTSVGPVRLVATNAGDVNNKAGTHSIQLRVSQNSGEYLEFKVK